MFCTLPGFTFFTYISFIYLLYKCCIIISHVICCMSIHSVASWGFSTFCLLEVRFPFLSGRFKDKHTLGKGLSGCQVWLKTEMICKGSKRLTYQASTEEAGPRALLLTNDATTADAVVYKFVLLGKAVTGISTWEQDSKPVLSLFIIEVDKLSFLLCCRSAAVFLSLRKQVRASKK